MKKNKSKYVIPLLLFFIVPPPTYAQNVAQRPKGLILGTSLTYRWDDEEGVSTKIIYQDLTWNLNVATYIATNWRAGLTSLQIFEKNEGSDWENFFMVGPMLQYDVLPKSKIIFIGEAGLFYGNFAPVTGDLIKRKETYFLDLGLSCELPISKRWFIDIGFNYYPVLARIANKDNFVLYVLGVNYLLGKR